jgi:hypothetical protein
MDFALSEFTKSRGWKELETTSDVEIAATALTFTDGVWDKSGLTLTKADAFASYTPTGGDHVYISGGTGMTVGWYEVDATVAQDDDVLTLLESPGEDATDVAATAIGNPEYIAIPTDAMHVVRVRLIDGTSSRRVELRTKGWLQERYPNIAALSHGRPAYGYEDKSVGRIYLYPVTDDLYTFRVTVSKHLKAFAEESTECPVAGLDLAIVAFATAHAFRSVEQFENAALWDAQAAVAMGNAIAADMKSRVELGRDEGREVASAEPWYDPFVKEV